MTSRSQVLKLYHDMMTVAIKKPPPKHDLKDFGPTSSLSNHIRSIFKERAHTVQFKDINRVEFFLNQGRRQLKQLKKSEFEGIFYVTSDSKPEKEEEKQTTEGEHFTSAPRTY
ncbi:hypothetical protein PROFUN_01899 [Planoprotostelium fungivorum]|uniref:Uncharacterized protein n=1 Tax=Planoprotostelium fungivorum TaxID=1890364 RepID=A0A2P6NZ13_9EUKA|nr:hypothetical protein PROFUN_01899 [Planoprotostelium fungivorum]